MSNAVCDCDPLGSTDYGMCDSITVENSLTAQCHCKENVGGKRCDECLKGFWNLDVDNPSGCQACDCNLDGSYDNLCDVFTGQCKCRPHMNGRRCNQDSESKN